MLTSANLALGAANLTSTQNPRYVFREGDQALIIDRRGRRYLIKLHSADKYHTHLGNFAHSTVIGQEEGARVTTSSGHMLLVVKPTMADFTRQMPRIATVVYPKDLGAILIFGDIFPGATVLEAGSGSGAVTIALARAVGDEGQIISYDLREDMIKRARANADTLLPNTSHVTFKLGDVYQGLEENELDRIILDLPEPWHVVPHAAEALVPGGVFLSFLPTVMQVHDLTQTLRSQGTFDIIETVEILLRPWSVTSRSIRPAQRMVGHTGFITTARRCSRRSPQNDINVAEPTD